MKKMRTFGSWAGALLLVGRTGMRQRFLALRSSPRSGCSFAGRRSCCELHPGRAGCERRASLVRFPPARPRRRGAYRAVGGGCEPGSGRRAGALRRQQPVLFADYRQAVRVHARSRASRRPTRMRGSRAIRCSFSPRREPDPADERTTVTFLARPQDCGDVRVLGKGLWFLQEVGSRGFVFSTAPANDAEVVEPVLRPELRRKAPRHDRQAHPVGRGAMAPGVDWR